MPSIGFNSNINSLTAQRQLERHSGSLGKIFQRLSSGQRINQASDDAAGLAVSSQLRVNARVFGQGILNANDGISLLSIAEGTLQQASSILDRINELATQAATGSLARTQRLSIETEASQLTREYNRIFASTRFNGRTLLDGSLSQFNLQLGFGTDGVLQGEVAQELGRASGSGQFGAVVSAPTITGTASIITEDFNNDGKDDLISIGFGSSELYLSNGNGTYSLVRSFTTSGSGVAPVVGDFNGDGNLDVISNLDDGFATNERTSVFLGSGSGTFSNEVVIAASMLNLTTAADLNGDGLDDLVVSNGSTVSNYQSTGNGSFFVRSTFASTFSTAYSGDFDGNGSTDLVMTSGTTANIFLNGGSGTFGGAINPGSLGSFTSLQVGDVNYDGISDIVTGDVVAVNIYTGKGNGTFNQGVSYVSGPGTNTVNLADYNNDGYLDIMSFSVTNRSVNIFLNQQNGSFESNRPFQLATAGSFIGYGVGDMNGDGVPDLLYRPSLAAGFSTRLSETTNITSLQHFNLTTQQAARDSLDLIATAKQRILEELGAIGALQSRLGISLNMLSTSKEQSFAAAGRITDIDVAEDSAALVRVQILQQVGSSVLSQANLSPQIALNLLQNA